MHKKSVDVVAAVIKKDNLFLVANRSFETNSPGIWEFPGGKVEEEETEQQVREREEHIRSLIGNSWNQSTSSVERSEVFDSTKVVRHSQRPPQTAISVSDKSPSKRSQGSGEDKEKSIAKDVAHMQQAQQVASEHIELRIQDAGNVQKKVEEYDKVKSMTEVGHFRQRLKIQFRYHFLKFQMKKVMCLNVAVGNVEMEHKQIIVNTQLAANFLASLLKKQWQNIGQIYIKSTMGPAIQIYF